MFKVFPACVDLSNGQCPIHYFKNIVILAVTTVKLVRMPMRKVEKWVESRCDFLFSTTL